jgi:hypothetical protein
MNDWRTIRTWSRDEMLKRVARFKRLKGSDGGLPDSPLPECRRKLYAVIGFQPPMEKQSAATTSPVGEDASAMPAIPIAEGFNLGYCKAKQSIDLEPYDVISFPVGVARRFMNVTFDEPAKEHLLMFIIGGNQPQAEFTPAAMQRCEQFAKERSARKASPARAQPQPRRATARRDGPVRSAPRRRRGRRAET